MSEPQAAELPSVWCVVANVTREPHHEGDKGEMRLGTRRLAPGAKVYCLDFRWSNGAERIRVLGHHRGGGPRLIEIDVFSKWLTDWRAKQVFHPCVVERIRWELYDHDKARVEAEEIAESFRQWEARGRKPKDAAP